MTNTNKMKFFVTLVCLVVRKGGGWMKDLIPFFAHALVFISFSVLCKLLLYFILVTYEFEKASFLRIIFLRII